MCVSCLLFFVSANAKTSRSFLRARFSVCYSLKSRYIISYTFFYRYANIIENRFPLTVTLSQKLKKKKKINGLLVAYTIKWRNPKARHKNERIEWKKNQFFCIRAVHKSQVHNAVEWIREEKRTSFGMNCFVCVYLLLFQTKLNHIWSSIVLCWRPQIVPSDELATAWRETAKQKREITIIQQIDRHQNETIIK